MLWGMKKNQTDASAENMGQKRWPGIRNRLISFVLCAALIGTNIAGTLSAVSATDVSSGSTSAAEDLPGAAERPMEITTAVIKDDCGNEQDLTDHSAVYIDYAKQVTLHIVVKSQQDLRHKNVEITVPDGLTAAEYPKVNEAQVERVVPESLEELKSSSTYGGYTPKSGKITFVLADGAEETELNIILTTDAEFLSVAPDAALSEQLEIRAYTCADDDTAGQEEYQHISVSAAVTGVPEPAEVPVEASAEEPAEETSEEPAEETKEASATEPAEEPKEEPAEEAAEKSSGKEKMAAREGDASGDAAAPPMEITTAMIRAVGVADQPLSDETSFTIDFSKQFTLHIAVESKLNLPNKKVEITVPDGLTVVEYPIPERGGMAESVTPESIDELRSVNNYGGYHPTNGTITYSLKNTAEKNSFNIVLAPDTVLWNRSSAQELKDSLKISVYTDDQTYQTISATPKITGKYNDTPDDNRAIQTGPRLSRIGVKTGVPTVANQPFALRQIWINPDKDYIDMPQFFKKLEITIALPYYTKNGSNIYAKFDHVTYDPAGQSTRPNLLDPENHKDADDHYTYTETRNDTDHTVTLTWTNLYLEYGQDYLTPYFTWTSDCDVTTANAVKWGSDSILNTGKTAPGCYEGKTPTIGAASAVGGTITWQDDSTWYLYNGDCTTFSFTAQAGESMSVTGKANNQPIYNNYASDSDIIYYLGQFHVVNQGGAASADKTVEFTYGNNDKIGVTAQKIPATTGNTVEVWYTTTTNSTERKYNGTLTSSGGFVTFTTQMAGLGVNEYFTKIKANVGSYEKDYVGYVSSRDQDPTSGYATTFGKLLTVDAGTPYTEYTNFASMKMYDTAPDGSTATSAYYTVKVTSKEGEIPLAMEQAYKENSLERVPILSKTSATAGDTITFNGLLSSSAYPYSSNNVTTDQEIYIRLPEKITVKNLKLYQEVGRMADKVFLLDAVMETVRNPTRTEIPNTAYKFEEVTSAEAAADDVAETGHKLYKITFTDKDNPVKVGWFTDGLGQYQIGISFDMEIAKDADAMTLDMRDCVRFKSASLTSTSNNGTLAQYQVMDEGVRYSTFNVNAKGTKLSVVAARLGLTFTFGARMTEKGSEAEFDAAKYSNFEVDKNTVYLKDANHVVDLLFTLKNETGREFSAADAQAFYYFIPVPEKNDFWDSHMQDQAFEFDMSLTRAPELQGTSKDHILVTYATEIESGAQAGEPKHYTNTANYMTEDKLLEGCATEGEEAERWREVKMIRIAAKPDITSIPKDAELKVNMRLEPMFDENADLVGSEINFGPCGVSPYSVGNTPNQGHNPLPRIQVEFQTGIIAGKIFIDKNFNGTYDEGTDALYTGSVTVEANHSNGNGNCTEGNAAHKTTATDGTFTFTGRRADTYHVAVTNPGSTDANGDTPLKFSLPESGGKFSLDEGKDTATASVVLDVNENSNDIKVAQNLMIGFQQPHAVTFIVPNGQGGISTKVWHGDLLRDVVPTVTADTGYRFTGNWTDGTNNTYTAAQLEEVAISGDVTFTAEVKQLYSLTYHLNGGSGADAPETSMHIEGEKVRPDYTGTGNLKKGDKTIFVGWSETLIDPLPEDAEKKDIDKIISTDEHTMPARNVILYAVYAVDANDNGNPDYNDDAVHVRYHGNNNVREDIICPHHHVAGATAKLSTSGTVSGKSLNHSDTASTAVGEVTSHTFTFTDKTTGNDHIFIGWSTSPILDTIIKTKVDYDGLANSIVTEVTMEKEKVDGGHADADGNTNVYAVWAADRNGNETADYLEEYTLTYDSNAQQGGTVSATPTDNNIYIPGDKAELSKDIPIHSDVVDGKKVVFIGWTETQTNSIFSRADTAPVTVAEVKIDSGNKTVYAAWGYDEDGDNTADVLETYTLTYDINGGNETAPAKVSDIAKNTDVKLTEVKKFTRKPNEIFVGWSVTKLDAALTAETKQEDLEKFLITGATYRIGTADVTLYAVWAEDRNGNKVPDYLEARCLKYEANPCDGTVESDTMPVDNKIYVPKETSSLSTGTPAHSDVDDKTVIFIGWTASATAKVHGRTDTAPAIIEKVTFNDTDITVYAAWAYDENNNGTADYLESRTLAYEGNAINGGTVKQLPTDDNKYIPGDSVDLSTDKPTHSDVDGKKVVFIGWTAAQTNSIYARADNAPVTIMKVTFTDANEKVYAAWGYDENNNDTADVLETYTLTYDLNGGHGTAPGKVTDIPKNTSVSVNTDTSFTRDNAIFKGWSVKRHDPFTASAQESDVNNVLVPKTITVGAENVTLYAVWAADRNGNNVPDYSEARYLTYSGNPQSSGTVEGMPEDTGIYIPQDKVSLSTAAPTHSNVGDKAVIFIGWTETATDKIYGRTDTAPTIMKDVTFDDMDITVYAAWAYDENNNGTADYDEICTLTYDGNAKNGGTVSDLPTDDNKYIPNDTVNLSKQKPTYVVAEGKAVVFIGWTETATNQIYSRTDAAPTTIMNVTFETANKKVYAAWGYDENDNGTADALETYTLTYDLNGGQGTVPAAVTGIQKNTSVPVITEKNFTRNENEAFAGWSRTKYETAFTAEQESELKEILISGEITVGAKNVTLYAVWAEDAPAVKKVRHSAYIKGYTDGTFRPENNMSRAEAAAIFARLLAEEKGDQLTETGSHATGYADVPATAWYAEYVKYLDHYGIIYGRGDQKFAPDDKITRAEFTAMVVRFFETCGNDAGIQGEYTGFIDMVPGHWATGYIQCAAARGWVEGYGDGTFRAERNITRAEAVTLVNKMLGRSADTVYVTKNFRSLNTFADVSNHHWAYMEVMEAANTHLTTPGKPENWSK